MEAEAGAAPPGHLRNLPADPATAVALGLLDALGDHSGEEPARRMLQTMAQTLGWEAAALWLLDLEDGKLRCREVWAQDSPGLLPVTSATLEARLSPGEGLPGRVLRSGRPQASTSLDDDPQRAGAAAASGVTAGFAFPVLRERPVGVVELLSREARQVDEPLLRTATALGRPLGGWLEHVQAQGERRDLLERLREAERRQRFLADVSRVLQGSLDPRGMLEDLARLSVPLITDGCTVHLVEEDGYPARIASVFSGAAKSRLESTLSSRFHADLGDREGAGRVLRTGLPVLYAEISDSLLQAVAGNEEHLEALRALEPVSAMVVPMPGPAGTLGALALISMESGRIYGPDDLALAEEVGRRAGLALANLQLYRRERSVASALQASLVPPTLPEIPGVELAGRFRAGREGVAVGGDFYDAFPIGEGAWAIAIGDVCGLGPEAAAMTTRVRYSARALASAESGPARMLADVNRVLLEEPGERSFCTSVYGWLRPNGTGASLLLACAGHPAPLVLRADGRIEEVRCRGTLLGMFSEIEHQELRLELHRGDLLLLYTDGVTEARGRDGHFGRERLDGALRSAAGEGAGAAAAAVEQAVLAFTGQRLQDDVALLAVRPTGETG